MTLVHFKFTRPTEDGDVPASGNLVLRPTKSRVVIGAPDTVILPAPYTAKVPETGLISIELEATGYDWAWQLEAENFGGPVWTEWLVVPEVSEIDYPELTRVDPLTLDPIVNPEPAWWAAIETIKGLDGIPGKDGAVGPQGYPGPTGEKGDQGEVGPQGLRGPSGGEKGEKGDTGLTGPAGKDGIDGAVGARGPIGEKGLQGEQGIRGVNGPQGIKGEVGPKGLDGKDGLTGPQGLKGDTGDQGIQGLTGTAGKDGADGIQGEKGEVGPEGPQGLKGDTGEQGLVGPAGSDGIDGAVGAQGEKGDQGEVGPKGDVGIQGPIGLTGLQGEKGDQGPAGLDGAPGIQGPKGEDGASGRDGIEGERGLQGEKGDPGAPGLDGVDGTDGIQGAKGEKGDQGPKGDTGTDLTSPYHLRGTGAPSSSDGSPAGAFYTDLSKLVNPNGVRTYIKASNLFGPVWHPVDSSYSEISSKEAGYSGAVLFEKNNRVVVLSIKNLVYDGSGTRNIIKIPSIMNPNKNHVSVVINFFDQNTGAPAGMGEFIKSGNDYYLRFTSDRAAFSNVAANITYMMAH